VLPGTPYQKVLLPLEYLPSRRYESRWGYSRPPHQGLVDLFRQRDEAYRQVIGELRELSDCFAAIPKLFTHEHAPRPGWTGGPINPLDSALIYYFVQHHRPATYLEIGSGVSTCFAKRAIQDHQLSTQIVSIDPEPRASIDAICDRVIRSPLETANLEIFESLQPGDILFMDGSHRSFMNSDVTVFMLDVLPLLKPGVIIHIHDILLPYDYHDSFKNWYWNEQYLVAVYLLAARERIRILMPSAYLTTTDGLKECVWPPLVDLGEANEGWRHGGSLWFTHTSRDAA
jgi:predicted O-methyltransferase YrrM